MWFATCPEDSVELDYYAKRGILSRIGDHMNATDGQLYAIYRENRNLFQVILEDLEAEGVLTKTSRTRRGRDGKMHPVYVAAEFASGKVSAGSEELLS